jgi:GxxExxY protein
MSDQLRHEELTRKIIGCAMQVHSALGSGFQDVIYQNALEIEMELQDVKFEREKQMPIFYKERQIGTRYADFFVNGLVMVELKAITQLEDVHLAQAINYLEAYNKEIGLLINFGGQSLMFKRLFNKKYKYR